jgi:CRP/FNR family cyclic AMP-dependent transcriptional regulator
MSAAKILKLQEQKPEHSRYSAHIKKVSLFADIAQNDKAIESLVHYLTEKRFAPHTIIIEEGKIGDEMFLLIEGTASVFKHTPDGDEYSVAKLDGTTHPFFGEGSLIDSETRSATIKADTDCYCLLFTKAGFENFSKEHPDWALPIFRQIAKAVMARLRRTSNDLLLMYNALVEEIRRQ